MRDLWCRETLTDDHYYAWTITYYTRSMRNYYKVLKRSSKIYVFPRFDSRRHSELPKPLEVLIDHDDLNMLLHIDCRIGSMSNHIGKLNQRNRIYATVKSPGKKQKLLHRFLLGVRSRDVLVDHKNGRTLDCRRHNLIRTDYSGNGQNRHGLNQCNTSGFRNVYPLDGRWAVRIQFRSRYMNWQYFPTSMEANVFAIRQRALLKKHGARMTKSWAPVRRRH